MRALTAAFAATLFGFTIFGTHAQEAPPTAEEQQMLQTMREQWKEVGLGDMTPQQEQTMLRKFREMRADVANHMLMMQTVTGSMGATGRRARQQQAAPANPVPAPNPVAAHAPVPAQDPAPAPTPEEAQELGQRLAAMDASGPFVVFERRKDGFSVNGSPFLDADGAVTDFGADGVSGAVTYLVDVGDGSAIVKHRNVHSNEQPVVMGTLVSRGEQIAYQGRDGKTAGGDFVKPTSRGLVVVREASLVAIDFRSGAVNPIAIPDGFHVAEYQNGDVGATRFVLLERDTAGRSVGGDLKATATALGALFGRDNRSDYALFNIDTGDVVPVAISATRNTVSYGSNCRRQNQFVNRCSQWNSYDALYEPDGRPNYSHYFWSLSWLNTKDGPVAAAIEKGLTEVNVIRLSDGVRANAFKRGMGIQYFTTETLADGTLKLVAYWAFRGHPVDDVSTLFDAKAP